MALDKDKLDSLRIDRGAAPAASRRILPIAIALTVVVVLSALLLTGLWWARLSGPALIQVAVAQSPTAAASQDAVLNASGYVVARRMATVSAKVTGKIAEVFVEEGMSVAAGQILARLDDATAKAAYALADSQLTAAKESLAEIEVRRDEARRTLDRTRPLLEKHLVSAAQLDTAEADFKAQQARLAAAKSEVEVAQRTRNLRQQDLDDLKVRAPFAGVVVSKDAQPGEMVSPLSAGGFTRTGICTLVDMSSREVEVDVNEAYINRVHPGQRTEAILDAYPDWVIPSSVINIVPTADRQRATVKVRIGFEQLDPRILPDMGIKVRFLEEGAATQQANSGSVKALIPAAAIMKANGNAYVWLVKDDALTRQAIKIGEDRSGTVAVLAGLAPGEQVALGALDRFKEGQKVRVKP
jgi:RND family efflux transporter MFP subunit